MLNIQSIQDAMKALIEGGYNPMTGGIQGSRVGGPDVAMAAQQQLPASITPAIQPSPILSPAQAAQMQGMANSLGSMMPIQQQGLPEVASAALESVVPAAAPVPRNTQFLKSFFNQGHSPYTQWRSQADAAVNPILDKRKQ